MRPRVKICCISSCQEAVLAIKMGAYAIGLVGKMPSGPGPISDDLIADIVKKIPPSVSSFLLTSEASSKDVVKHLRRVNTNTVQIVDDLTTGTYQEIRSELPMIKIVQVLHVTGDEIIDKAKQIADQVDGFLLDSGNPRLNIKVLGGTGRVHDWRVSRKLVEAVDIPVFLAGGLNSENVESAIEEVQPFGVDVCTGVRTDGKLDQRKLELFMNKVFRYYN